MQSEKKKFGGNLILVVIGLVFLLIIAFALLANYRTKLFASQTPIQTPTATQASNGNSGSTIAISVFADKNKYYQIDVPSGWAHESETGAHFYIDQFTPPDGKASIKNFVFDDGTPFTGLHNDQFASQLLNQFYGNADQAGVHITFGKIQSDGSGYLAWSSQSGYSGESFYEVRGTYSTAFLMFTIAWADSAKDQYYDTLANVAASYTVP